jgi:phenylalanine-4-hydroxylase
VYRPFDLERVCETDFEIDHYQPIYYVLESFEQLRDAMNEYAERVIGEAGLAIQGLPLTGACPAELKGRLAEATARD